MTELECKLLQDNDSLLTKTKEQTQLINDLNQQLKLLNEQLKYRNRKFFRSSKA